MIVNPDEPGEKLEISGVIYKSDGKTPAPNVILYVYQTAKSGLYEPGPNQTGGVRRHGRIRGWVKTNQKGEYKFLTIRPGNYPEWRKCSTYSPYDQRARQKRIPY